MVRYAVLLLILFTCIQTLHAQVPPDKALSTFQVPAGMQLQLFASEPMFTNPTSMDVDERGRVWVCESVNYRWKLLKRTKNIRPEGDRIVILEDTDGDGKADKATTFYQSPDLLAPLGIAVAKNASGPGYKVYVCHSPHLYLFEDKDGDGKADGPPEILLTGFNGIDHDHGIHGIHFGPDGKLYFSVGDQGVKNLFSANGKNKEPKPGEKVWSTNRTDCQAGTMWRCNTDGTNLELLAHNFRNQYEPAVNSFGTMFTSDNDDDGNQQTRICHVMYGGNYGYWPRNRGDHHWHEDQPGVVHKTLRTGFGSPTGMCWYEGKLLHGAFRKLLADSSQPTANSKTGESPKLAPLSPGGRGAGGEGDKSATNPYEGYLLHTDAGPREVRLFGVRPKGAGYELEKVNLVTSTDNWFRPSDVCVAPDGSIMIADWYDPGVGGHGMGDTTRGRIYRLTTKEISKYVVKPMNLDGESVLDSLHSPCLAARQTAMNTLKDLNIKKWIKWVWHSDNHMALPVRGAEPIKMARDMWAICQHKKFAEIYPQASVLDCIWAFRRDKQYADAHYRGICFEVTFWSQLMMSYTDQMSTVLKKLGNTTEELERGFENDSSVINRVFLVAMRYCKVEDIKECFYKLATAYDGQDRTYLSALNIALGTDPQRRAAILDDFEKHFPDWNDKTAWLVWELQPPRVVAKLGQKLANEKLSPLQTELALGAMAASSGTDGGESLLKLVSGSNVNRTVRTAALKTILIHIHGKWNTLKKSDLVRKAIEGLQSDRELLPAVIELVTACERKDFQGMLENFAYNNGNISTNVRNAAIQGLGKLKNEQSVTALKKLLNPSEPPEIRQQVIMALGTITSSDNAMTILQEMLLNSKSADFERLQSLQSLASSRLGTTWLLTAKSKNELPADLVAETGRLLRSSPHQDLRNKALIAFPVKAKMDVAKLPSSNELAKQIGSADRGRLLVSNHKDLACTKCHSIQGDGGKIGPDLSMIGIKGSKENLFDSILTPDKAIADQYVQYTIETKNGVVMTGLVVEETTDYVVLRDANGKDTKLAMREIEQRSKSAKSIMPDNLASYLTEEELIDVVAYLTTLKTPALSIDSWKVLGPFPSDENASTLKKALAPEAGIDLKANYQGKRGNIEWRTIATNAQNQLDLVAIQGDEAVTGLTYLYAEIDVPQAGIGEIKLGTTEAFHVNFNGKHVFQSTFGPPLEGTKHSITIDLNKGINKLLIKISTSKKPQPITCTILTPGSEAAKLK